ncbi:hypothetical protein QAD02_010324 [Eretmocerus hayati]|uniref:Uncharacterized protein n=1 Tax=Eretmocerus hayati TaxID=131215 RepID=A0ACC2NC47_9HYME|nr:hypothetical protein QAD02_010324 [Eretmocerus hayati]
MTTYHQWSNDDRTTCYYNLAIAELGTETAVRPATVSVNVNHQNHGTEVTAIGWGQAYIDGEVVNPHSPRKLLMTVIRRNDYVTRLRNLISLNFNFLHDRLICAISTPQPALVIRADIGGPVLDRENNVLGMIAQPCAQLEDPSIYNNSINFILSLKNFTASLNTVTNNDIFKVL